MKIRRMLATFGCLENAELRLEEGLNIIELPNEGGKSTWLAFILAMFYGIDTSERDKKGVIADKNLYLPWSGSLCHGLIELDWEGRPVTLERKSTARAMMQDFLAYNSLSGQPIASINAENCGRLLLGVNRSVFERSAFIGQGRLGVEPDAELEERLLALVSTGDERYSFSRADDSLAKWLRLRKSSRNTGEIPELEAKILSVSDKIQRISGINSGALELSGRLERLKKEKKFLEAEIAASERRNAIEIDRQIKEARTELELENEESKRIRRALSEYSSRPEPAYLQNVLRAIDSFEQYSDRQSLELELIEEPEAGHPPCFEGLSPGEAEELAATDRQVYESLINRSKFRLPLYMALTALPALALAAAAFFVYPNYLMPLAAAGGGWLVVFVILTFIRRSKAKKAKAEAEKILEKYAADSAEGIRRTALEYKGWLAELEAQSRRREAISQDLEKRREAIVETVSKYSPQCADTESAKDVTARLLSLLAEQKESNFRLFSLQKLCGTLSKAAGRAKPLEKAESLPELTMGAEEAAARLSKLEDEQRLLESSIAMKSGEARTYGDYAALAAELEALNLRLDAANAEYRAITLARKSLEKAQSELQERFSPMLNTKAAEIMSRLSKGRYDKIMLGRDMNAHVRQQGQAAARSHLFLSSGAVDQLYLSVRLALCAILLDENTPVFLDDALTNFDDERASAALDYLYELSASRQVFVFTCHSREAAYLEKREENLKTFGVTGHKSM